MITWITEKLKEKWKFYCDWYELDEWIKCFIIGFGIAFLWLFCTGIFI